jgi:hypothetical protein
VVCFRSTVSEQYRTHLRAHGFEWILELGADARTCEDVLVYADAREERRFAHPPLILDGLRLLTLLDTEGRPISRSVPLSSEGEIIRNIEGEIGGYRLEILGRARVRRRFRGKTAPASSATVFFDGGVIRFEGLSLDRDDMDRLLRAIASKEATLERSRMDELVYHVVAGEHRGLEISFGVEGERMVPRSIRCVEGRTLVL